MFSGLFTAAGFKLPVKTLVLMFSFFPWSLPTDWGRLFVLTLILLIILLFSSYDGVPFLMHDQTLQRTTNVHEVFPNRTNTLASMFTWAELESLNAGAWFLSVGL